MSKIIFSLGILALSSLVATAQAEPAVAGNPTSLAQSLSQPMELSAKKSRHHRKKSSRHSKKGKSSKSKVTKVGKKSRHSHARKSRHLKLAKSVKSSKA